MSDDIKGISLVGGFLLIGFLSVMCVIGYVNTLPDTKEDLISECRSTFSVSTNILSSLESGKEQIVLDSSKKTLECIEFVLKSFSSEGQTVKEMIKGMQEVE